MKKLTLIVLSLLLMVSVSLSLSAHERGMMFDNDFEGMGKKHHNARMMKHLGESLLEKIGVSNDMILKLKNEEMTIEKDLIKLKANLNIKNVDIAKEMLKDKPNENTLKSISEEIGKIKGDIRYKSIERRLLIKKNLTKKQLSKLRNLKIENLQEKHRTEKRITRKTKGF